MNKFDKFIVLLSIPLSKLNYTVNLTSNCYLFNYLYECYKILIKYDLLNICMRIYKY